MKEQYELFDRLYPELALKGQWQDSPVPAIVELRIEDVMPSPLNPRKHFDQAALDALADSIRERGVLSPIKVYRDKDVYVIVMGERRWRAAKMAGLTEIPAIIVAGEMDQREHVTQALLENLMRSDLSAIEEARGFQALIESGMQQADIARQVGRSPSSISNLRRLLELPEEVVAMIEAGQLTASHGVALAGLADEPDIALEHAVGAITCNLTSKELEAWVADYKRDNAEEVKPPELVVALVQKAFVEIEQPAITDSVIEAVPSENIAVQADENAITHAETLSSPPTSEVMDEPAQPESFRAESQPAAQTDEAARWRDMYNEQIARREELIDAQCRIFRDAAEHHEGVAKSIAAALKVANEQMDALRNRPLAVVLAEAITALPPSTPGEFIAVLAECSSWLEDPDSYGGGALTSAMDAAQAIMDGFAPTRDVLTEQEHEIWSDLYGGSAPGLSAAGILEILAAKRLKWLRDNAEETCP